MPPCIPLPQVLMGFVAPRSESKTGLDKSDRKGGAGAHNWGSYADEQDHELRAAEDYQEEEGLATNVDGVCT